MLEKTLENPLDCKEIKSLIFIRRTDGEAEAPILWLPDVKNWLIGKDPDAWKDWRQEEKGTTEDEMVGWHHQVDGYESEHAPGVSDGQESLACFSPWGCKESDTTEQLNWTELTQIWSIYWFMDKLLGETICLLSIHSSNHFHLSIQLSVVGEYQVALWTNIVKQIGKWYNRCYYYRLTKDKSTVKLLRSSGIMGNSFYA